MPPHSMDIGGLPRPGGPRMPPGRHGGPRNGSDPEYPPPRMGGHYYPPPMEDHLEAEPEPMRRYDGASPERDAPMDPVLICLGEDGLDVHGADPISINTEEK